MNYPLRRQNSKWVKSLGGSSRGIVVALRGSLETQFVQDGYRLFFRDRVKSKQNYPSICATRLGVYGILIDWSYAEIGARVWGVDRIATNEINSRL